MSARRYALVLGAAVGLLAPPAPAAGQSGIDLSSIQLPDGFLELSDLTVSGPRPGTVVATATTTLMGNQALALLASFEPDDGGKRAFVLALKPTDFSLTRTFPALANPVLDQLTLQYVALAVTDREVTLPAAALSGEEYAFYREVYQSDDFTVRLMPGVNLIGAIPAEGLPPDHPMVAVMDALGIEKGVILLQGTLGQSLTLLTNPAAGGADIIKDLYLRAELPPMRPPGSPAWFRGGQLALELTGLPSVRLVGEIGITIDDDLLDFFLAATLARTGVSLSGGLRAEGGWNQPFGIEWLVMHELIFSLGITPTGSIQPGFAGRMVIGEKDIDVAVSVAISPAGVPTNFIFDGASEAGFGLSDLVMLQAQMRAARDAATAAAGASGAAPEPIPLDALPDIAFKDVGLKFAPKPSPELGVERGMAIKGQLWITPPSGAPVNFAGVDVNVGEDGFWARGHLEAFTAGPLVWDDAELDLTLTPETQHFLVSGQVQLFSARQLVDLELTRQHLRFRTESELYDLFRATLSAQADFDLRQPAFQVDGVAESDLAELLDPVIREAALRFVDASAALVAAADATVAGIDEALGVASATTAELRRQLEAARAAADAALQEARRAAASAQAAAADAWRRRQAAYALWRDTPSWRVALKAARRADYARWNTVYLTRAGQYAARRTAVTLAARVLAAIPPVDQNVLLLEAEAGVRRLRAQLAEAREQLQELSTQIAAIDRQLQESGVLLAIERAEFHAGLDGLLRGEAMRWNLRGTFVDAPFAIEETLTFADPTAAAAQLFEALLQR